MMRGADAGPLEPKLAAHPRILAAHPYDDSEFVLRQLDALRRAKKDAESDPCCDEKDVASVVRTMKIILEEYSNHYHTHATIHELNERIRDLSTTIRARNDRLSKWRDELDFGIDALSSNLGSDFVARQLKLVAKCNALKVHRDELLQELRSREFGYDSSSSDCDGNCDGDRDCDRDGDGGDDGGDDERGKSTRDQRYYDDDERGLIDKVRSQVGGHSQDRLADKEILKDAKQTSPSHTSTSPSTTLRPTASHHTKARHPAAGPAVLPKPTLDLRPRQAEENAPPENHPMRKNSALEGSQHWDRAALDSQRDKDRAKRDSVVPKRPTRQNTTLQGPKLSNPPVCATGPDHLRDLRQAQVKTEVPLSPAIDAAATTTTTTTTTTVKQATQVRMGTQSEVAQSGGMEPKEWPDDDLNSLVSPMLFAGIAAGALFVRPDQSPDARPDQRAAARRDQSPDARPDQSAAAHPPATRPDQSPDQSPDVRSGFQQSKEPRTKPPRSRVQYQAQRNVGSACRSELPAIDEHGTSRESSDDSDSGSMQESDSCSSENDDDCDEPPSLHANETYGSTHERIRAQAGY